MKTIPTYTGTTQANAPFVVVSFTPHGWTRHKQESQTYTAAEVWARDHLSVSHGCGYMILPKDEATLSNIRILLYG